MAGAGALLGQPVAGAGAAGATECIEINGLEDAVKLAVCICIKFDSQK